MLFFCDSLLIQIYYGGFPLHSLDEEQEFVKKAITDSLVS